MPITMTDFAQEKIANLMARQSNQEAYLRVGLQGGGCSGFMYNYEFLDSPADGDKVFIFGDVKICIDRKSYLFLNGMEIDYEEDLLKSGLVFKNPKATRTCGCGESVAF